jgi:hypothetical protein
MAFDIHVLFKAFDDAAAALSTGTDKDTLADQRLADAQAAKFDAASSRFDLTVSYNKTVTDIKTAVDSLILPLPVDPRPHVEPTPEPTPAPVVDPAPVVVVDPAPVVTPVEVVPTTDGTATA